MFVSSLDSFYFSDYYSWSKTKKLWLSPGWSWNHPMIAFVKRCFFWYEHSWTCTRILLKCQASGGIWGLCWPTQSSLLLLKGTSRIWLKKHIFPTCLLFVCKNIEVIWDDLKTKTSLVINMEELERLIKVKVDCGFNPVEKSPWHYGQSSRNRFAHKNNISTTHAVFLKPTTIFFFYWKTSKTPLPGHPDGLPTAREF